MSLPTVLSRVILAIIVYSLLASAQPCTQTCVSTQNGCRVCFKQCVAGNSTTFYFDSCYVAAQDSSSQPDPDHQTVHFDLESCSTQCCDDSLVKFQNPTLTSCLKSQRSSSLVVIIVISILVSVFVILCCIVSAHPTIRQKIADCLSNTSDAAQVKSTHPNSSLSRDEIIQNHPSQSRKNRQFYDFTQIDSTCSICLESECNASTICGHAYHASCIYEWIMHKLECPLCKSKQIKTVSICCRICHLSRKKVWLQDLPFLRVKELNAFECQQCKAIQ